MFNNPIDPNFFGRARPDDLELPAFMQASLEAYRARQQAEQRPMADVQVSPYSNPAIDVAALQQRMAGGTPLQAMNQDIQNQMARPQISATQGQPSIRNAADYKTMLEITKDRAFNEAAAQGDWARMSSVDPIKAEKLQAMQQNQEKHALELRLKQLQLAAEPTKLAKDLELKAAELQKSHPEYKASQDRLAAMNADADLAVQGLAELDKVQPILESGVLGGFLGTGGLTPGLRSTLVSGNYIGDVNTKNAWKAVQVYQNNRVLAKARALAPVTESDADLIAESEVSIYNDNDQNLALAAYDRLRYVRSSNRRDFVNQYMQIPGVSQDFIKAEKDGNAAYQKFINARPAMVSSKDWKLNLASIKDASTPEYNDTTAYLNELRLNGGNYKDIQLASPQKTRIQEYKAAQAIAQQDEERAAILRARFPNLGGRR